MPVCYICFIQSRDTGNGSRVLFFYQRLLGPNPLTQKELMACRPFPWDRRRDAGLEKDRAKRGFSRFPRSLRDF